MFPQLGPLELMVVMGVAVLLFGKRLPEVGRSLGKGIIEFKKGLRGIEDGFDISGDSYPASKPGARHNDDHARAATPVEESSVPKFEPPTAPPVPHMEYEPQATSTTPQD